jgi:hypothetical protein
MYPGLQDHPTVKQLPNVAGMRDNVFWLDHANAEDQADDDQHHKYHSNAWEVAMVTALVRHIVRQGAYKSTDIAVLTPYAGQVRKLRAALDDFEVFLSDHDEEALVRSGFEADPEESQADDDEFVNKILHQMLDRRQDSNQGRKLEKKRLANTLRLATVDNFQGEEAKVVVVSLVRSNPRRKVGFLRTTNRINVLLSRAQHGLYLIGNAETYSKIAMWSDIQRPTGGVGCHGKRFPPLLSTARRHAHRVCRTGRLCPPQPRGRVRLGLRPAAGTLRPPMLLAAPL